MQIQLSLVCARHAGTAPAQQLCWPQGLMYRSRSGARLQPPSATLARAWRARPKPSALCAVPAPFWGGAGRGGRGVAGPLRQTPVNASAAPPRLAERERRRHKLRSDSSNAGNLNPVRASAPQHPLTSFFTLFSRPGAHAYLIAWMPTPGAAPARQSWPCGRLCRHTPIKAPWMACLRRLLG